MDASGYVVVSVSAAVMASIMGVGGQALGKEAAMKVFCTTAGCSGEVVGVSLTVGSVVSITVGVESVVSIGLLKVVVSVLYAGFLNSLEPFPNPHALGKTFSERSEPLLFTFTTRKNVPIDRFPVLRVPCIAGMVPAFALFLLCPYRIPVDCGFFMNVWMCTHSSFTFDFNVSVLTIFVFLSDT